MPRWSANSRAFFGTDANKPSQGTAQAAARDASSLVLLTRIWPQHTLYKSNGDGVRPNRPGFGSGLMTPTEALFSWSLAMAILHSSLWPSVFRVDRALPRGRPAVPAAPVRRRRQARDIAS